MNKLLTIIGVFFCLIIAGKSQNAFLNSYISEEIRSLEMNFHDNIFLEKCSDSSFLQFKIVCTYYNPIVVREKNNYTIHDIYLTIVGVKIDPITIFNISWKNRDKLKNDTLYYYLLTDKFSDKTYKLFGFYNTDINLFFSDQKLRPENAKYLSYNLTQQKILSQKESKYFTRAITKERKEYPLKLNKPCELLKYFFEGKDLHKANTIILPLKPMLPFTI